MSYREPQVSILWPGCEPNSPVRDYQQVSFRCGTSRPALGSTHPVSHWLPEFIFSGLKRPMREGDDAVEVKNELCCTYSTLICLNDLYRIFTFILSGASFIRVRGSSTLNIVTTSAGWGQSFWLFRLFYFGCQFRHSCWFVSHFAWATSSDSYMYFSSGTELFINLGFENMHCNEKNRRKFWEIT